MLYGDGFVLRQTHNFKRIHLSKMLMTKISIPQSLIIFYVIKTNKLTIKA